MTVMEFMRQHGYEREGYDSSIIQFRKTTEHRNEVIFRILKDGLKVKDIEIYAYPLSINGTPNDEAQQIDLDRLRKEAEKMKSKILRRKTA